jgi:hypothetical protein
VFALHLLLPVAASAADAARETRVARAGEFCRIGGCRGAAPGAWPGAAFGAAVLAIAWTARRRDADR